MRRWMLKERELLGWRMKPYSRVEQNKQQELERRMKLFWRRTVVIVLLRSIVEACEPLIV